MDVQARIMELRPGDSCCLSENEAVIVIARSDKSRDSLLAQVDPLFWELERDERKKIALLDREMRAKAIAWKHGGFTIEKLQQGVICYFLRGKTQLFLMPDLKLTFTPVYYAHELDAYARARKYHELFGLQELDELYERIQRAREAQRKEGA